MYDVFVWVPTKGWKLIRKVKTAQAAYDLANEFLPLEVKVSCPNGRTFQAGSVHTIMPEITEWKNTLDGLVLPSE